jgi:hypothetical protein
MAANYSIWDKVWNKWMITSDNTFLDYLTCSTDPNIIRNYLRLTKKDEHWRVSDNKKHIHIILLIVAKHAKNDVELESIFEFIEFELKFGLKK